MDRAPDKTALEIMRPTRRIDDFGATHLIVGGVSIALEDSFKVS